MTDTQKQIEPQYTIFQVDGRCLKNPKEVATGPDYFDSDERTITFTEYADKLKEKSEFFKTNNLLDFYKDIDPNEKIMALINVNEVLDIDNLKNVNSFDLLIIPRNRPVEMEDYFFTVRLKKQLMKDML